MWTWKANLCNLNTVGGESRFRKNSNSIFFFCIANGKYSIRYLWRIYNERWFIVALYLANLFIFMLFFFLIIFYTSFLMQLRHPTVCIFDILKSKSKFWQFNFLINEDFLFQVISFDSVLNVWNNLIRFTSKIPPPPSVRLSWLKVACHLLTPSRAPL